MSVQPRIARGIARGPITRPSDPVPVYVILRWATKPPDVVPAHAVAWTTGRDAAVQVEWLWDHPQGGRRKDWVRAVDVLREQPTPEQLRELLARPVWMPARSSAQIGHYDRGS